MEFPKFLTAGYIQDIDYFDYKNCGTLETFGGTEGRLFKTLSDTLKFRYKLVEPPDAEWGTKKEDGNWTGIIRMLIEGEVDLSVLFFGVTTPRIDIVEFSIPYQEVQRTIVSNYPQELSKAFILAYSFRKETWIGILVLLLAFSLVAHFLSHRKHLYVIVLLETLVNLVGKSFWKRPGYSKWLASLWWLDALVISIVYSAIMTSVLFTPFQEKPVRGIQELARAVEEKGYKVFTYKGSNVFDDFYSSDTDSLVQLGRRMDENRWYTELGEFLKQNKLEDNTFHIMDTFEKHYYWKTPDSRMFTVDETFPKLNIAVVMRKNFCCVDMINDVMKKIRYSGIYLKYVRDQIFKHSLFIYSIDKVEGTGALTLDHTSGAFVLLLGGLCFSTVVLMMEIIVSHVHKNGLIS